MTPLENVILSSEGFITPALLVLICVSILIAVYYRPEEFDHGRIRVFVSFLGSIAVFLVGLNLIISSMQFRYDRQFSLISKTKEQIDKLWLHPNEVMAHTTSARNEFLAGFFLNNSKFLPYFYNTTPANDITIETLLDEQYISLLIIQAWEDFLTARLFDKTGEIPWICCFIQWAQNPHLRPYFDTNRHNQRSTTIVFGELLFEYAARLPLEITSSTSYLNLAEELLKDPRLISLFSQASS